MIQIDAAGLARSVREQSALPLTQSEAQRLARAIETSSDDEALLTRTLSMVTFVLDRLETAPADLRDDDQKEPR